MLHRSFETPVGPITITVETDAVVQVQFRTSAGQIMAKAPSDSGEMVLMERVAAQIDAYFAASLPNFDLPVRPTGTPFHVRVWTAMTTIPAGRTLRYGDLARHLRTGPRAIGGACKKNPIPLLIPCHRVVGSTGLGGYSGGAGLPTKTWLLEHERGMLADRRSKRFDEVWAEDGPGELIV